MNSKKGKIKYSDGSVYIGSIKNDKRHGKGTFIFTDSMKYEGDWVENERCGYGILTYPDGAKYEGEWNKNDFHGIYTSSDGEKFKQYWINGKKICEEPVKVISNSSFSSKSYSDSSTSDDIELRTVLKEISIKYGKKCFMKYGSANNLLADLLPGTAHKKQRRRIRSAVDSGACETLMRPENDPQNQINSAIAQLIDFTDMAEDIAANIINILADILM